MYIYLSDYCNKKKAIWSFCLRLIGGLDIAFRDFFEKLPIFLLARLKTFEKGVHIVYIVILYGTD